MKKVFFLLILILHLTQLSGQTSMFPFGSLWKYNDSGNNLDTVWRNTGYDDSSWLSGFAQLGYGDGDEGTVVSYGSDANNKYITTYFRKTVNIPSVNQFSNYQFNFLRDDGIVVYVNGYEIFRDNMPTTPVYYTTLADTGC